MADPMKIPRASGLKSVDTTISPSERGPFLLDPSSWPTSRMEIKFNGALAWKILVAPFDDPRTNPGFLATIVVMVLVFLACLINGWLYVIMLSVNVAAAGDNVLRPILLALVSSGTLYLASLWTYDDRLLTYVYPEFSFVSIPTLRVGFLTACLYGIFQFAGYWAAGGILQAMIGTVAGLTNVATSTTSYVLAWFGTFFICVNYIYNMEFKNNGEGRIHQHDRASVAAALSVFVVTLAFFSLGLVGYSSGLYVTGVWVTGNNQAGAAVNPNVNPWAFFVFVPLLASTAAAAALYLIIGFLIRWQNRRDGGLAGPFDMGPLNQAEGEYSEMGAPLLRTPLGVSKRIKGRQIEVNY
jgi:hypothetical protein